MYRITLKHSKAASPAFTMSLLLAVCWLFIGSYAFAQHQAEPVLPPEFADMVPKEIKDQISLLSGRAMLTAAKVLGIKEMMGKSLTTAGSSPGNAKAKKLKDVGIGVHPTNHENEPTVASNPKDKKRLVAGSHFLDETTFIIRCVAYRSADRGATWSAPFPMPQLTPESACSDPVLAYAPDGSRIYYAYMDIKFNFDPSPPFTFTMDFDIVESYSDDNGATWTGPIVALDSAPTIITFDPFTITPGFIYDKPWIGTHVHSAQSNWVYVSATRFDDFSPFDCHIAFTRSGTKGIASSWGAPTLLDSSSGGCGNPVVVQGSRPTGGLSGEVLVAWYNSGTDGWLTGSFEIRTARSGDHGATFDPFVTAVMDSSEAPFFLGPSNLYHRWWGTMFPDVEIDSGGAAHIVYTHDPVDQFIINDTSNAEDGDIRYISSLASPYDTWSSPVTVNDDGLERAQGYAALETQHGGRSSTLHVIWEDHRLSPEVPAPTFEDCIFSGMCDSSNIHYDIFSSRKVPGKGVGWFENFRISDTSSISDFLFIGDYNDVTANATLIFTIWTDRRDKTSIFDFEDDVFGSRIIAGGGTPKGKL